MIWTCGKRTLPPMVLLHHDQNCTREAHVLGPKSTYDMLGQLGTAFSSVKSTFRWLKALSFAKRNKQNIIEVHRLTQNTFKYKVFTILIPWFHLIYINFE